MAVFGAFLLVVGCAQMIGLQRLTGMAEVDLDAFCEPERSVNTGVYIYYLYGFMCVCIYMFVCVCVSVFLYVCVCVCVCVLDSASFSITQTIS